MQNFPLKSFISLSSELFVDKIHIFHFKFEPSVIQQKRNDFLEICSAFFHSAISHSAFAFLKLKWLSSKFSRQGTDLINFRFVITSKLVRLLYNCFYLFIDLLLGSRLIPKRPSLFQTAAGFQIKRQLCNQAGDFCGQTVAKIADGECQQKPWPGADSIKSPMILFFYKLVNFSIDNS